MMSLKVKYDLSPHTITSLLQKSNIYLIFSHFSTHDSMQVMHTPYCSSQLHSELFIVVKMFLKVLKMTNHRGNVFIL